MADFKRTITIVRTSDGFGFVSFVDGCRIGECRSVEAAERAARKRFANVEIERVVYPRA